MASKATTRIDHQAVLDELAREIRKRRPDCPPREAARMLLSYHQPGHSTLVGLGRDASRALLYHETDRYVVSVRIRPRGLPSRGLVIADLTGERRFDEWLRFKRDSLEWLHPTYRGDRRENTP